MAFAKRIRPGLYLGNREAAEACPKSVTHLLSLGCPLDSSKVPDQVAHLAFDELLDLEDTNLLDTIPACTDFISKGLATKKVD